MNAPLTLRPKTYELIIASVGKVLLGKERQVRLALACLLARGHLLIEDLPGMGKTTLAQALARVLGLQYNRIQFTSDLLPADILGLSIFDKTQGQFTFHPGPVFCQLLLADEINRSTPKTQSALLEAMAEGQVTVEGQTRQLPDPYFVIATQNPQSQAGTFPLPESQQDRFMLCLSLGYPNPNAERELLTGGDVRNQLDSLATTIDAAVVAAMQEAVAKVKVAEPVIDYLQRLIQYTRDNNEFSVGLSPRAGLAILQCARAWATIHGRDYAVPEDIQAVFPEATIHRLRGSNLSSHRAGALVEQVLNAVVVIP
jgi:MoxR-like ATPase